MMQQGMWQWSDDRLVRAAGVWVRPSAVIAVRKGLGGTVLMMITGQEILLHGLGVDETVSTLWEVG